MNGRPSQNTESRGLKGERPLTRGALDLGSDVAFGVGCILGGEQGPTAIAAGCRLGDYVTVQPGVRLGAYTRVGSHVELGHPPKSLLEGDDPSHRASRVADLIIKEPGVLIGEKAQIRSHSTLYLHVQIGARLVTGHHVLIREHTAIGSGCVLGSFSSCDGYTLIGDNVHIGQYAQLSQAARISQGSFVGGHTVFSDNRMAVRCVEDDLVGAVVEEYVRIGLACVILPGVRIGQDSMIGAGSVVTKEVPPRVLAYGNPCRVVRDLLPEETDRYRHSVKAGEASEQEAVE